MIIAVALIIIMFFMFLFLVIGIRDEITGYSCFRCHRPMEEYGYEGFLRCKYCEQYKSNIKPIRNE